MNILFVCTANISRSFLAEKLMRHEIGQRRLEGISVKSAGVYASPGAPCDPIMAAYLADRQIEHSPHLSRRIEEADVVWADRILVMERTHAEEIVRAWPLAEGKVEPLGRYVSMDSSSDDVIDPYGRTPYHYRLAQSQITLGLKNFIETQLL